MHNAFFPYFKHLTFLYIVLIRSHLDFKSYIMLYVLPVNLILIPHVYAV